MGNLFSKCRKQNNATMANNPNNVTYQDCNLYAVSGGNVNIENQSVPATVPGFSKAKEAEKSANDPKNILRMRTKTKSKVEITKSYPTLHEPSVQFSPQMRKINNYYGGGYCKKVKDEFQLVRRLVTTGDPITYETFLKIISDEKAKRIALIGGAGYGKSTEMKKLALILLDEEDQETPGRKHFDVVHTINFKDMPTKEFKTLQDCLFDQDIPNEDDRKGLLEYISENQSRCTIFIDGLDQARYDTKVEYDKVSHWQKASNEAFLYNLMSGSIFPDVKVVVSSREHAITTLPEEARPECVIALAGFKQEYAKSLFLGLVKDDNQSWENIKRNLGDLLSVLVIPIYLIFTAIVYKHSKEEHEQLPTYVTGLLSKIIGILPNNKHMRKDIIVILQKLKQLAYDGIKDRLLSFDESYLNNHGLSAQEVSDLLSMVPKKNYVYHRLLEKDFFYFFCHQSMEEFLAACYILEMSLINFKSFIEHEFNEDFNHWSNVIQYLSGIALNQEIQLGQSLSEISDKNKKQGIMRDALLRLLRGEYGRRPPPAFYLALHESNDDELIRQWQVIKIYGTPLTSNLARAISSLMRRSKSVKLISLGFGCGMTDEVLRLMAANMKDSHLRVEELCLLEEEWDVTCSTLKSFLDNLEVDQLGIYEFPTDYHENFPDFENVKTLKMDRYDVIITNKQDRVLFKSELYEMSGNFNKKKKLLKLHFNEERDDDLVSKLKKLCSPEKVEVTGG